MEKNLLSRRELFTFWRKSNSENQSLVSSERHIVEENEDSSPALFSRRQILTGLLAGGFLMAADPDFSPYNNNQKDATEKLAILSVSEAQEVVSDQLTERESEDLARTIKETAIGTIITPFAMRAVNFAGISVIPSKPRGSTSSMSDAEYALARLVMPAVEELIFRVGPRRKWGNDWLIGAGSAVAFGLTHNIMSVDFSYIPAHDIGWGLYRWHTMISRASPTIRFGQYSLQNGEFHPIASHITFNTILAILGKVTG